MKQGKVEGGHITFEFSQFKKPHELADVAEVCKANYGKEVHVCIRGAAEFKNVQAARGVITEIDEVNQCIIMDKAEVHSKRVMANGPMRHVNYQILFSVITTIEVADRCLMGCGRERAKGGMYCAANCTGSSPQNAA